jgi:hypothetical protein
MFSTEWHTARAAKPQPAAPGGGMSKTTMALLALLASPTIGTGVGRMTAKLGS